MMQSHESFHAIWFIDFIVSFQTSNFWRDMRIHFCQKITFRFIWATKKRWPHDAPLPGDLGTFVAEMLDVRHGQMVATFIPKIWGSLRFPFWETSYFSMGGWLKPPSRWVVLLFFFPPGLLHDTISPWVDWTWSCLDVFGGRNCILNCLFGTELHPWNYQFYFFW